jgi:hypothetical protein
MDNYYTKYLKYKSKYLELKRTNGGRSEGVIGGSVIGENITEKRLVGGTPCKELSIIESFGKSVWWYIRNSDCTYDDLLKKVGKNNLDKITYRDFQRTNNEHKYQQINVTNLKNRGFSALLLKNAGFPLSGFKDAGFTLGDLPIKNFSLKDLKNAGFTLGDLDKEGIILRDIIKLYDEIDTSIGLRNLKDAGFTLKELGELINLKDLKYWAFIIRVLKKEDYTFQQLIDAGFSAKNFKEAGFSA